MNLAKFQLGPVLHGGYVLRVNSLTAFPKQLINRFRFSVTLMASLCLSLTVLSACNNIKNNLNGPSSLVQQSDPSIGGANFTLSSIAADAVSPRTVLDLIGINSQFDTYCALGTCMCEYTFQQAGAGTQVVQTPTTYQESNLVRCANGVPNGINNFEVRITVMPSGSAASGTPASISASGILDASNSLSGSFSSGDLAATTSYMDLTNAATYVPVQRFQCRKREFIANPMNVTMADPFQSQNPNIIYPFNYYTTNVAQSLLTQQQSVDASWECTLNATQDHSLQWWANPNVFSLATCSTSFCNGDGALIYPQTSLTSGKIPVTNLAATGKRRSSFYLASQNYSVFQIPVKAAISPLSYVASNYATIGYAAKPIASSNGTSACPSITLPPNATWVKLWNFRATDITPAKKVTSSPSILRSTIVCDTTHPTVAGNDVTKMLFPSCQVQDPNGNPFGMALDNAAVTAGTALASRVAAPLAGSFSSNTSACYNFGNGNYYSTPNQTVSIPWHTDFGAGASTYGGVDAWVPSPYKMDDTLTLASLTGFPWNFYTDAQTNYSNATWTLNTTASAGINNQWLTNGAGFVLPSATPMDYSNQITTVALSPDNYTDQIFVVTDPSISDSDMRNNSSNIQQYVPRTFRTKIDCPGPLPCDPNATGKTPINWGINTQDVGASTGTDTYPLCVLQFYD